MEGLISKESQKSTIKHRDSSLKDKHSVSFEEVYGDLKTRH